MFCRMLFWCIYRCPPCFCVVNLCSHSIPIDILHVISATCLQPLFSLFSILQHLNNWNVLKLSFKRQDHSYNNNFVLSDFSWQVAILHLQNCFFYDVCLFEFHLEVFANNCVHMFNLHVLLSYLIYLWFCF